MKKIHKLLIATLFFVLVIPSVALASWWNPFSWQIFSFLRKEATPVVQQIKPATSTPLITDKITPVKTQKTVKVQEGQLPDYKPYELISNSTPIINNTSSPERGDYSRQFSFSVKIKNMNVLPFVTGVKVGTCRGLNATGGTQEYYSWGGKTSVSYNKALLPGEEAAADFTYSLETSGSICSYNNNGIRTCEDPYKDVNKITSCDFTVSTDTDLSGSGKFKQTLVF